MQEPLITFKTAKLAKEKGFIKHTDIRYMSRDVEGCLARIGDLTTLAGADISAPTQSLLQKWLREKHNLHIILNTSINTNGKVTFYCNTIKFGKNLYKSMFRSKSLIYTYEEALEVGLREALKLI